MDRRGLAGLEHQVPDPESVVLEEHCRAHGVRVRIIHWLHLSRATQAIVERRGLRTPLPASLVRRLVVFVWLERRTSSCTLVALDGWRIMPTHGVVVAVRLAIGVKRECAFEQFKAGVEGVALFRMPKGLGLLSEAPAQRRDALVGRAVWTIWHATAMAPPRDLAHGRAMVGTKLMVRVQPGSGWS